MAAQPSSPNATLSDDQLRLILVGSIFTSMSCIVLILRLLVLQLRRRTFGKDDATMLAGFLCSIGFATGSFISVRWGVGLKITDPPLSWIEDALKAAYVVQIFYVLTMFFVKISLLFLYLRIANGIHTYFYKGTIATLVLLCLNIIPSIIVSVAQCTPPSKYWTPLMKGRCVDINATFYFNSGFTIFTDCIMLALPVHTLWTLQRPRGQRIALLATFLIGGISTIASCVRLYTIQYYQRSGESLQDLAPIDLWSFLEIDLGILCASVPAIKPLFLPKAALTESEIQQSPSRTMSFPSLAKAAKKGYGKAKIPMRRFKGSNKGSAGRGSVECLIERPPHAITPERLGLKGGLPPAKRVTPDPDTYHAYVSSDPDSPSDKSFDSRDIKVTRSIEISGSREAMEMKTPVLPTFQFGRSLERLCEEWSEVSMG